MHEQLPGLATKMNTKLPGKPTASVHSTKGEGGHPQLPGRS